MNIRNVILTALAYLMSLGINAQIVIDDSQTVEWNVLNKLAGSGVVISNIKFNSNPITDVNPQIGNFNSTNANVGINTGLILSNGNINSIIGPNDEEHYFIPTTAPAPTDPDLLSLAGGIPVFDGAILEFTFVPNGDTVEFDFVFASEEYPEFVGTNTNDVFGFFVAGPGIVGPYSSPNIVPPLFPDGAINVALIPGTPTPVSINNVNAGTNSSYFISNGDGTNAPFNSDSQYIQADGFTTPITVKFPVQCGQQYYIKFALGDGFDNQVDSYVFIEEDSFSVISPTEVNIATGNSSLLEGCESITLDFTRTNDLNEPHSIDLTIGGTATNSVDYSTIPSQIDFPVGIGTVSLTIDALADAAPEGLETLTLLVENYGTTFCGNPIASSINISIIDNISAVLSGGGTICPGDSTMIQIDITGTPPWDIEYTINGGAPISQTVTASPYVFYSSVQEEYILTSVSSNGCPGLASGSATTSAPPVPALNVSGGGEFCAGDCMDAVFTMAGTPPFTIIYSIGGVTQPTLTTNNLFENISICESGIIEPISIQSLSASSCYGNINGSATFTKHELPTLSIPSEVGICSGNDAIIPFELSNGTEWTIEYTYNGLPQTPLSDVVDGDFITAANSGTYIFTQLTTEGAPFCVNSISETVLVDVYSTPTAVIPTIDTVLCIGASMDIPLSFTGTGPWQFEYTINGVNFGPFQSTADTTLTVNTPGTLTLISFSDGHCAGTTSGQVEISYAFPIVNLSDNIIEACDGETVTLTSAPFGGINEPYNLSWTPGSSTSSDLTITPTLTDSNTEEIINYSLTVSQPTCGINYIIPFSVVVKPIPSAMFTSTDSTVCPGEAVEFQIATESNSSYVLEYTIDGLSQTPIVSNDPILSLNANEEGVYEIVSIQNDYCANTSISSSFELSYYEQLSASLAPDDTTICQGSSIIAPVNFTGLPPFTFEYLINGSLSQSITTSDNPYMLTISDEGTHSIGIISNVHCQENGTGACSIGYFDPITFEIEESLTVCEGDEISIAPENIGGGDSNSYSYNWTANSSVIGTESTLTFNPIEEMTIELHLSDQCNVDYTRMSSIEVENYPIVLFNPDKTEICPDELVHFENNSILNTINNTFEWSFGDNTGTNLQNSVHRYEEEGYYTVSLSITTPFGCKSTDSIINIIHVNPGPTANFISNPEIGDMSEPEIEFQNLSTDESSYHWSFGDGYESEVENPVHRYPEDHSAKYTACLEVTNIHGCKNELCKDIEIRPIYNLFMPNTFTPDGDGVNELFGPVLHTSVIDSYLFQIYDRDGHIVFHSADPTKKWNGSYLAETNFYAMSGIYSWTLRVKLKNDSDVKINSGFINLMR